MSISPACEKLLACLANHAQHGQTPTRRELADELSYASVGPIGRMIEQLEQAGVLERGEGARNITLTDEAWALLGERPQHHSGVPILGNIAAGSPILAEENCLGYLEDICPGPGRFALQVNGDSMIGDNIYDGDYVVIDSGTEVYNGEIGAVRVEDDVTLKHVLYSNKGLCLRSSNDKYDDIIIEHNDCEVIGKLRLSVKPYNVRGF